MKEHFPSSIPLKNLNQIFFTFNRIHKTHRINSNQIGCLTKLPDFEWWWQHQEKQQKIRKIYPIGNLIFGKKRSKKIREKNWLTFLYARKLWENLICIILYKYISNPKTFAWMFNASVCVRMHEILFFCFACVFISLFRHLSVKLNTCVQEKTFKFEFK